MVGYDAGIHCTAKPWLAALDMAVNRQFPAGVRGQSLSLMSDHGCQPPSLAFMAAGSTLSLHQAFTSDHNPKGNAETERVIRTLTEACLWRQEWARPFALIPAFEGWVEDDNAPSLPSHLGYRPPAQFERDDDKSHGPPFVAA